MLKYKITFYCAKMKEGYQGDLIIHLVISYRAINRKPRRKYFIAFNYPFFN